MASSRVFIKGLPPSFTDAEFRKHFSQGRELTDVKILPGRRIGYVGYKTPEEAQKAVKYFNKTFIRMSRIGVELAKSVSELKPSKIQNGSHGFESRQIENDKGFKSAEASAKAPEPQMEDPKLQEFLTVMKPKSKKKTWEIEDEGLAFNAQEKRQADSTNTVEVGAKRGAEDSEDEYEHVPKKKRHDRTQVEPALQPATEGKDDSAQESAQQMQGVMYGATTERNNGEASVAHPTRPTSDSDWMRSRTSRVLDLADNHENMVENAAAEQSSRGLQPKTAHADDTIEDQGSSPVNSSSHQSTKPTNPVLDADIETVRTTMRLFVRNLPYDVDEQTLETEFEVFGNLEEVHVPIDKKTGRAKGFAYVQFANPDSAEQALLNKDQQIFQGRLLHVLPASAKRESGLDDFALSKLPLKKQQQIKRRRDASNTTFNWNALYMNADAVVSSVAERLGLSKAEVLDPTSSDAAIKQAHAETHVIQETKAYFQQQGIDLDSFKRSQRGDSAILAKNIPYDTGRDELKKLFEEHGDVKHFLMPPAGTIAIVEYANAAQCKAAFAALAYRKINSSVLFLEKAPKDVFNSKVAQPNPDVSIEGVSKTAASDLKVSVPEVVGSATLFVRNLNFSTTTAKLTETFSPLEGFLSARVKTKTDPKKPGQILSMGFGFLDFRTSEQAQAALVAMDGYVLDGHTLQVRASHKGADAAEERRKADAEKRAVGKNTKVIIKNLPFQATRADVRALFGAYGQLRSVRVPKKMDRTARGFAFADFVTPKEAESAMESLKDTHLLGRRLVLELAAEDPEDAEAEIEKMQQKVERQVNRVALQKLTSGGRKRFSTQNEESD